MLANSMLMRQRRDEDVRRWMKMSVDGKRCPSCDVFVSLQFSVFDRSFRCRLPSVVVLRPVAGLASRSIVSCLRQTDFVYVSGQCSANERS